MIKKFQKVRLVVHTDNEQWRSDDDDLLNQRCLDRLTSQGKKLKKIKIKSRESNNTTIDGKKSKKDDKFVVPLISKFKAT